jgi:hypothetical protein
MAMLLGQATLLLVWQTLHRRLRGGSANRDGNGFSRDALRVPRCWPTSLRLSRSMGCPWRGRANSLNVWASVSADVSCCTTMLRPATSPARDRDYRATIERNGCGVMR